MQYDDTIYEVTVIVTTDDSGLLTHSVTITNADSPVEEVVFTNNKTYDVPFTIDNIVKYFIILFVAVIALGGMLVLYKYVTKKASKKKKKKI